MNCSCMQETFKPVQNFELFSELSFVNVTTSRSNKNKHEETDELFFSVGIGEHREKLQQLMSLSRTLWVNTDFLSGLNETTR